MHHPHTERRIALRAILAGDTCVVPAPVHDPVTAVLAGDMGFALGMVGGSSVATSVLAAPDIIVLTLTELADHIRRMTQASPLPLMIDGDHGYGNAHNAARTVVELEYAGAAGMSLEDTDLPARWGAAKPSLIPIAEATDRLSAALAARTDPQFVIAGRTSFAFTTNEDAVARAIAYATAGADAIFLHGMTNKAQVAAVRDAVDLPIILGLGLSTARADLPGLTDLGVRIALAGQQPLQAAIAAAHAALAAIANDTPDAMPPRADKALQAKANRAESYAAVTAKFMGKPQ